jgi:IMP dehydrogenase
MGSVAMETGSKDRYFQDVEDDVKKLVPEGIVCSSVPKERLNEKYVTIHWWSSCRNGILWFKRHSYTARNRSFCRITASGINESHPHNVTITKKLLIV